MSRLMNDVAPRVSGGFDVVLLVSDSLMWSHLCGGDIHVLRYKSVAPTVFVGDLYKNSCTSVCTIIVCLCELPLDQIFGH